MAKVFGMKAGPERLAFVKELFPAGTRIVMIHMEDKEGVPAGTKGTVTGIDALGDLLVDWDNGSHLKAIVAVDIFIHEDKGVTRFMDKYEMEAFCNRLKEMEVEFTLKIRNWGDGFLEYVVKPGKEEENGKV